MTRPRRASGKRPRRPSRRRTQAAGLEALALGPACGTCGKPATICVCDAAVPCITRLRVVILQHPQEQDRILGTVPLLLASMPRAEKHVGLSWPSLRRLLGEEVDYERWGVLFPQAPKGSAASGATGVQVYDRHGQVLVAPALAGIVVLDGSWSQAKALWWRNPWLLKLRRVVLRPQEPSAYGRLRPEPRRDYVSTLEAVADALPALGEAEASAAELRRLFRRLVQRARDAVAPQPLPVGPAARHEGPADAVAAPLTPEPEVPKEPA